MSNNALNYVQAYSEEAAGDYGKFGIKILISTDHPITEAERISLYESADRIKGAVLAESIQLNPKERDRAKSQREDLIGLFHRPIYVEEIPNGYCARWCCKHLPWFIVTTTRGRINIGWRKSVIEISWDSSVAGEARQLFPSEQVTMGERYIHAWGYNKAREYIAKLLSEPIPSPTQQKITEAIRQGKGESV